MKPTELMLGSVVEYDTEEGWEYNVLDWQDLKYAQVDWSDFAIFHRPIPLTPEIFEKCPLPPVIQEWYVNNNTIKSKTGATIININMIGYCIQHVHTLQMFLRSIGLEWQLDGLFNEVVA